jgi:small-conductance mechanosensitive channel
MTRAALACGMLLFAVAADKPDDKARVEPAAKAELSKLPNDDLLKQAAGVYGKGSGDYLAARRALAAADARLADADAALAAFAPPKPPDPKAGSAEDAAKVGVDAAKARADAARARLKLAQACKLLRERAAAGIEAVQSAASALQTALDELKPFALELDLRAKDGTLPADQVPPGLTAEALAEKRAELTAEQEKLYGRLVAVRTAVEADGKRATDAEKAVLTAEAEATEAARGYAREQSRRELEKKYAGKSADEMLAEIAALVRDGQGLKGTYELAYRRFADRAAAADRLRQELAALKPPEAPAARITRAEDVEPAVKATEAVIRHHADRGAKAEALRAALAALVAQGREFEGDAAVSDDHLFKMQVVSALLAKAGVAEKAPEQATPARLASAAERAKKLAAEVRAGADKADAELDPLAKEAAAARAAGDAAAAQRAALNESREATLSALRFEEQLDTLPAAGLVEQFRRLGAAVAEQAPALKAGEDEYRKAVAAAADARAKLDALKDPLLRAAEEQGQAERRRIAAELRKEAGLDPVAPPPDAKKPDDPKPAAEEKAKAPDPPPAERVAAQLAAYQQQLAARARVLDEREEKAKALLAALDDLDTKAAAFSKAVNAARQAALQRNAAAVAIKTRVGRGELDGTQLPDGLTDALAADTQKKLGADAAAVLNALAQNRRDRDALKAPDPQADALRALTKDLLALAGRRLDLLADLKKLAADYDVPAEGRPDAERKRLDRAAAERIGRDGGRWDWLLGLDTSKPAAGLTELMETYYRELIGIETRDENLKKQKAAVDELLDLAAKERAAVVKGAPLLEAERVRLEAARDEAAVLARARLKPEAADELLKAHQAKTGRTLARPVPVGEKDRAARADELAAALFGRYVEMEAARAWADTLAARLGTAGLAAESGVYQDELARATAAGAANARRVTALTGEIGTARAELETVRTRGVRAIGVKVAAIVLAALVLPRVILFVLRRALGVGRDEAGSPSMVLTAVGAFVRAGVWVAAFALVLSTLGFDVTAIVAGLGIGGLAIGLAAQPMIADVIGAVVIFAERRFKIGDVVRMGADDPARVVGLTWRSTALRNADGLVLTVPNRKVTETNLVNMTRDGQTYDSLAVTVTTTRDVAAVLQVIRDAMSECRNLSADHGVAVRKFTQKGETKVAEYRFWWFLRDYDARGATRDEVFARVAAGLADENLSGTEVTLS